MAPFREPKRPQTWVDCMSTERDRLLMRWPRPSNIAVKGFGRLSLLL